MPPNSQRLQASEEMGNRVHWSRVLGDCLKAREPLPDHSGVVAFVTQKMHLRTRVTPSRLNFEGYTQKRRRRTAPARLRVA